MTRWTEFIKDFAKRNNVSYGCAMSDPKLREEYYKKYPIKTKEQKLEDQEKSIKNTLKLSVKNFKNKYVKPHLDNPNDSILKDAMVNKYRKFSQRLKDFIKEKNPKIYTLVNNLAETKDKKKEEKLEQQRPKETKAKAKKKVEPKAQKPVIKKTEEPKKEENAEIYRKTILEANKKIKLFNRKNLEKTLMSINDYGIGLSIVGINNRLDTMIRRKIELFSKTKIISDKDIDVFKKGSGKIKNRMFNIIDDLKKLIFNKKTTKPAVDFINFLNNETNKREKLYIAVKIQQSFDEYCNKLNQLEDFVKIIRADKIKVENYNERIKFLDERCLDLIEIIDDLKEKFNITDKQIEDNELMIF